MLTKKYVILLAILAASLPAQSQPSAETLKIEPPRTISGSIAFGGNLTEINLGGPNGVVLTAVADTEGNAVYLVSGADVLAAGVEQIVPEVVIPSPGPSAAICTVAGFGRSIVEIGDLNNDSWNDIAIGAPLTDVKDGTQPCTVMSGGMTVNNSLQRAGAVYIYSGASLDPSISGSMPPIPQTLTTEPLVTSTAASRAIEGNFGQTMVALRGASIPYLAVAAPGFGGGNGAVWIYDLSNNLQQIGPFEAPTPPNPSCPSGSPDPFRTGSTLIEATVAGQPRLLIGSPGWDCGSGRVDIVTYGGTALLPTNGIVRGTRGEFGQAVVNLGDRDSNGSDEVAIGGPKGAGGKGEVIIIDLTQPSQLIPSRIREGSTSGDGFGSALAIVNNVSGTGNDGLAIGAPQIGMGTGYVEVATLDPATTFSSATSLRTFGETMNSEFGAALLPLPSDEGGTFTVGIPEGTVTGVGDGAVQAVRTRILYPGSRTSPTMSTPALGDDIALGVAYGPWPPIGPLNYRRGPGVASVRIGSSGYLALRVESPLGTYDGFPVVLLAGAVSEPPMIGVQRSFLGLNGFQIDIPLDPISGAPISPESYFLSPLPTPGQPYLAIDSNSTGLIFRVPAGLSGTQALLQPATVLLDGTAFGVSGLPITFGDAVLIRF